MPSRSEERASVTHPGHAAFQLPALFFLVFGVSVLWLTSSEAGLLLPSQRLIGGVYGLFRNRSALNYSQVSDSPCDSALPEIDVLGSRRTDLAPANHSSTQKFQKCGEEDGHVRNTRRIGPFLERSKEENTSVTASSLGGGQFAQVASGPDRQSSIQIGAAVQSPNATSIDALSGWAEDDWYYTGMEEDELPTSIQGQERRECAEGCHVHGTCNLNTGECFCPPHLEGPNCTTLAVPACRSHVDLPETGVCFTAAPGFGWDRPVDCECHRQCAQKNLYVKPGQGIACYEQTGVPAESRISRLPQENHTTVMYYFAKYLPHTQELRPLEVTSRERVITTGGRFRNPFVTLDRCPNQCNYRGSCMWDKKREAAICLCDGWFRGLACEFPRYGCIGNCSGHGVCKGAFCHCEEGYWGVSCQLSLEVTDSRGSSVDPFYYKLWPTNVRTKVQTLIHHEKAESSVTSDVEGALERILSTGVPRIYVYELPAWINKVGVVEGVFGSSQYDAPYYFLKYLANDSSVRVADPEQADLFYVPFFNRMMDSNLGIPRNHVWFTLQYIRRAYPYWDRKDGRDHIWFFAEDWGGCLAPRFIRNSILIAHWGPMKVAANESDPLFAHSKYPRGFANNDYECYHPSKDVVAPSLKRNLARYFEGVYRWDASIQKWEYQILNPEGCGGHRMKFWFKGTISRGKKRIDYSMGVRQKVNSVVANLTGYVMVSNLGSQVGTRCSDFCLVPEGYGWGNRDLEALASGCIPVVVDTKVAKLFWDVLPWPQFAVIVPYDEMDRIPEIIDDYTAGQILDMKRIIAQHHRVVDWEDGGSPYSAYGYTVHSLARRFLTNVLLPDLGIINATLVN